MRRRDLAKRLVSASKDAERRQLLASHKRIADAALAREIKDACYAAWTTDPATARKAASALRALQRLRQEGEIAAISRWIDGIAHITQGKFEPAVEKLDAAGAGFRRLKKPVDAAQTQVAKLIALALLGRYEDADKAGRQALMVFEKVRDHVAAGKIEMNLSNIAARRERHSDAEKFALSALRRFKKADEKTWQTMAENDLANTYSEINDFRKAEKYFAMAAQSARAAKMRVTEAEIEASMGNLELFRARYGDALRLLERSRQKYDELEMPHQTAIAELEIAEIYTELNLLREASLILGPLAERLRKLRLRAEEARARTILARVKVRTGEPALALRELSRARRLYEQEENLVGLGRSELLKSEIELLRKNFGSAAEAANKAAQLLKDTGNRRFLTAASLLKAESDRLAGQTARAKAGLNKTVKEALKNEHLAVAAQSLNSVGKLSLSSGNRTVARTAFNRAVKLIEGLRAPIASDEFRMSFLAGHLEPYNALVGMAIEDNRTEEAFMMHEASRSRALADVLEIDTAANLPGKLGQTLETAREELNWFYSRLSRDASGDDASEIEKEIAKREREVGKLTRRIESTSSRPGIGARSLDLIDLRSRLGQTDALIEFVSLNGRFGAFVITDDKLEFVGGLASEAEVRPLLEGLRFQFGTFRFGAEAIKSFAGQLKANSDHYLGRLYLLLFKGIEQLIGDRKAIIAPTGTLNYVPFNALFDGSNYLVEKREISTVPSAAVWLSLKRRRNKTGGEALLMGYADDAIPLAEAEVRTLGRTFSRATTLSGDRATFRAFLEKAPKATIIHLACHGQFRSDNPMFSSLRLADGWITVQDICRERLGADLVTLSACETGLNEIQPGEELLGLTRGFLTAGARSLLVSLWTVNDEATAALMRGFYKSLQLGSTPAASLRASQQESIGQGLHPYYWSPFISVGV